jgi:hypothetical protein
MSLRTELPILQQAFTTCHIHKEGLNDALFDLKQRPITTLDLEKLSKQDRRLFDQFAYRYTRLQDDMGARLIPAILGALEEDVSSMATIDRLNRLEQLGWLPSAEEWAELRSIRNEFTHDYPEKIQERFERFQLAIASAQKLLAILAVFNEKAQARFFDH